jgi:hypothetical protein
MDDMKTRDQMARKYGFDVVGEGYYYAKYVTDDVEVYLKDKSWEGTLWSVSLKLRYGGMYIAERNIGVFYSLNDAVDFTNKNNMRAFIPRDWKYEGESA